MMKKHFCLTPSHFVIVYYFLVVANPNESKSLTEIVESAKTPEGYCDDSIKVTFGPPLCPTLGPLPMYYKEEEDKCCVFCAPAIHVPKNDGTEESYKCPTDDFLTWLIEDFKICCGSERLGTNRDGRKRDRSKETDYQQHDESCVDLHRPGKPSDCPFSKEYCNHPIYYDLMTEQCPRTCNRCDEATKTPKIWKSDRGGVDGSTYSRDEVGGKRLRGSAKECRDGVKDDGTSDCPDRKHLCRESGWEDFMSKECPVTCNTCDTIARRERRRKRSFKLIPANLTILRAGD